MCLIPTIKVLTIVTSHDFTFFYVNKSKYWFRENFRLPVFDGFTRFGNTIWMFMENFCLPVCVWQKFCSKCSWRTNARNFHETLYLVSSQHKLVPINFCWKSFHRWGCNQTFSRFFGMRRPRLLLDEMKQKFLYKIYTVRKNDSTIFVHIPH